MRLLLILLLKYSVLYIASTTSLLHQCSLKDAGKCDECSPPEDIFAKSIVHLSGHVGPKLKPCDPARPMYLKEACETACAKLKLKSPHRSVCFYGSCIQCTQNTGCPTTPGLVFFNSTPQCEAACKNVDTLYQHQCVDGECMECRPRIVAKTGVFLSSCANVTTPLFNSKKQCQAKCGATQPPAPKVFKLYQYQCQEGLCVECRPKPLPGDGFLPGCNPTPDRAFYDSGAECAAECGPIVSQKISKPEDEINIKPTIQKVLLDQDEENAVTVEPAEAASSKPVIHHVQFQCQSNGTCARCGVIKLQRGYVPACAPTPDGKFYKNETDCTEECVNEQDSEIIAPDESETVPALQYQCVDSKCVRCEAIEVDRSNGTVGFIPSCAPNPRSDFYANLTSCAENCFETADTDDLPDATQYQCADNKCVECGLRRTSGGGYVPSCAPAPGFDFYPNKTACTDACFEIAGAFRDNSTVKNGSNSNFTLSSIIDSEPEEREEKEYIKFSVVQPIHNESAAYGKQNTAPEFQCVNGQCVECGFKEVGPGAFTPTCAPSTSAQIYRNASECNALCAPFNDAEDINYICQSGQCIPCSLSEAECAILPDQSLHLTASECHLMCADLSVDENNATGSSFDNNTVDVAFNTSIKQDAEIMVFGSKLKFPFKVTKTAQNSKSTTATTTITSPPETTPVQTTTYTTTTTTAPSPVASAPSPTTTISTTQSTRSTTSVTTTTTQSLSTPKSVPTKYEGKFHCLRGKCIACETIGVLGTGDFVTTCDVVYNLFNDSKQCEASCQKPLFEPELKEDQNLDPEDYECINNSGERFLNNQVWRDENFKYKCTADALSWIIDVVSCIYETYEMKVGSRIRISDVEAKCERLKNGSVQLNTAYLP